MKNHDHDGLIYIRRNGDLWVQSIKTWPRRNRSSIRRRGAETIRNGEDR